jgi:WD40 repeat protein/class 3 adenylate cyclase
MPRILPAGGGVVPIGEPKGLIESKSDSVASTEAAIRTFLIADVRGYTSFTAERGDEAAATLAARFAALTREAVEARGGAVVELRGDEALVVFDSARQAIRSAIELQTRFVDETVSDPRIPLAVGIGLDAGEAVAVEGGFRGGALNLAARLCSLAGPGEILASREVVHLARRVDGIRHVDRGDVTLKGLPDPVRVIRLRPEADDPADDTAFRRALGPAAARLTPAVPGAFVPNPYKGLRPFEEADAPNFFGREELTKSLLRRLGDARFLAVVGPSGSGKSSVVRAGLIPALRRGALPGSSEWLITEMVPGLRPLDELEAALLRVAVNPPSSLIDQLERDDRGLLRAVKRVLPADGPELLLFIDQFEEVFTLVPDEDARTHFLQSLEAAVGERQGRLRVIVTLRADFYDRPLLYRGFAELLRSRVEAVVPLAPQEFERAIAEPARRVDVRLEEGLVTQMVADVAEEPGALPLLQYSLTELFERREDHTLTVRQYREIEGVAGALGRRAEELYGELDGPGKEAARQLFLRLVALGEGAEDTRRPVARMEIASLDVNQRAMATVIDSFGASRLLSFDRDARTGAPTVEVAHEALLTAWPRLRRWIDEAREDLRTERRLALAAREWLDAERDPSFLLAGSRLEQFEGWRRSSAISVTPEEREFVEASVAERDRRQAEDEAREARERELERRSFRRLRAIVAVLAGAALIAAALTVFAFTQRGRAEQEGRVAVARELAAAAVANLEVDAERSILLALEAVNQTRAVDGSVLPEAEEALHRAVVSSRIVFSVPGIGGWLDWSPDGTRFVTEGPEETGKVDIRNAETGESMLSFTGHDADLNQVAFSSDGAMLATTGDDGTAKVWDPESGQELGSLEGPEGPVLGPSFSPDGALAAAAWLDEDTVRVWEVATGRTVHEIDAVPAPFATAFSPDGERLAIGGLDDSVAVVVDVRSGEEMLSLEGHEQHLQDVDWSPDGKWIATSSFDATVGIWDARTGDLRFSLFHDGPVVVSDWSPDGGRLVTGGSKATVWEITEAGGERLFSLSAQDTSSGVQGVAFSPDGNRVLTGDGAITSAKVWDVGQTGDAEWANIPGDPEWVTSVAFSPSGRELIASGENATVAEWDPQTGESIQSLPTQRIVVDMDLSPDGALIATMGYPTKVSVWDRATGRKEFTFQPQGFAENLDWSPDGGLLAIAAIDSGQAIILDRSGQEVAALRETSDGAGVLDVQFSPDGRLLATASTSTGRPNPLAQRVKIWDWESGETLTEISVAAEGMAFDPSGESIAIAHAGLAGIWDVDSGQKLRTFAGHEDALWDVAFSPDGSMLATAGFDNTVRLWDVDTGVQLLVLRGHDLVVGRLAFSPDGSKLASGAGDGTARVWALDLDDLIRIAEGELTRGLTEEECRQYLHEACPQS